VRLATILNVLRALARAAEYLAAEHPPKPRRVAIADGEIQCADCGAEPFAVQWGRVHLGYELDGYYSQLSGDGPRIICRECWERSLGIGPDNGA